jgi:CHAD domain-containing protein
MRTGRSLSRAARTYRLKTAEGAPEGLRRIAGGRAEKALDQLAGAEKTDLAAAIHGARKDLKKLRAVLRLIRGELGKDLFKAENRRYRDVGRLLSGSRDAEVKLQTLKALRSRFGDDLPADASRRWEGILERERDDAVGDEIEDRIVEAVRAIERGRDRIGEWPLRTDSWKLIGPGLSTAYREGRRAMKRTLADPQAENVHEWRKRAKDLWYQLRVVREAWPELLGATADQAHELSDLLGDHHDLAVLEEDLASRQEVGEKKTFKKLIGRRQEELLARALEIGRRLYAEKPKGFSRRLKRYWSAWRGA